MCLAGYPDSRHFTAAFLLPDGAEQPGAKMDTRQSSPHIVILSKV